MLNWFSIGEATEDDINILESKPSSLSSETEYNEASLLCYVTYTKSNRTAKSNLFSSFLIYQKFTLLKIFFLAPEVSMVKSGKVGTNAE